MAVMKVPKTPRKAFDPHRRPSALLLSQIEHLEWAALPAAQRKPGCLPAARVRTEGQAAARIAQLTRIIRDAAGAEPARAPGTFAPVQLPPLPRVPTRDGSKRRTPSKAVAKRRRAKPAAKPRAAAAKRPAIRRSRGGRR